MQGVFPRLDVSTKNPSARLKIRNWHTGEKLEANYIYYNNRHDEYRITGLRTWFVSAKLVKGDLIRIKNITGRGVLEFSYLRREQKAQGKQADYIDDAFSALEGAAGSAGKRRRRASILKKKAAKIYGSACLCCGFNGMNRYASIKKVIIDFHHVNPLGAQSGPVRVLASDLIPLCPNCHRAVHTKVPPIGWEDLKKMLLPSG